MTSIIEYYEINGLNYTATASSVYSNNSDCSPYNVFINDERAFNSGGGSPGQWWQVSFEIPVAITSYIITTPTGYVYYPKRWNVSYSSNGYYFTHLQEDS